jgi:hypothetical protein
LLKRGGRCGRHAFLFETVGFAAEIGGRCAGEANLIGNLVRSN